MEKFGEIPGLYYLVNPVETAPTVVNGFVTEVNPVVLQSEFDEPLVPFAPATGAEVAYDPATIKIGEMPAFQPTQGVANAFTHASGKLNNPIDGPCSAVLICEPSQLDDLFVSFDSVNTNNSGTHLRINNVGDEWRPLVGNGTGASATGFDVQDNVPTAMVLRWNADYSNEVQLHGSFNGGATVSGEMYTKEPPAAGLGYFYLFDNKSATVYPFKGKIGLFALYAAFLTDQQVEDCLALCNNYIATGATPNPPVSPKDGKFHANTNDPQGASVALVWQWAPVVPDGGLLVWADAITSLSNARYSNDNGETNDTLNIDSAIIADNGWVRSIATADYMADPVYSDAVRLTVQEES